MITRDSYNALAMINILNLSVNIKGLFFKSYESKFQMRYVPENAHRIHPEGFLSKHKY